MYPREYMDAYMTHFHEKAVDCCDPVIEEVLVDVCHYGMIYLENLSFSLFSWLIEAPRQSKESMLTPKM